MKKYRSLSDIYLENSAGKQVPSLNYKPVREATVTVKFDNGEVKEIKTNDRTAAKLIGVETEITHNLDSAISKWLEAGGWRASSVKIARTRIKDILNDNLNMKNSGVVKEVIEDINTILKNKIGLNNFYNNLKSEKYTGFVDRFPLELKQLNNSNVVMGIFALDFTENKVGIGPGEVLATLYSEMVNPKVGDLKFPKTDKTVELKASGGRPGSGSKDIPNAYARAIASLAKEEAYTMKLLDFETVKTLRTISKNAIEQINKTPGILNKYYKKPNLLRADYQSFLNFVNYVASENFVTMNDKKMPKFNSGVEKAGNELTGNLKFGTAIKDQLKAFRLKMESSNTKTFDRFFTVEKDVNKIASKIALFSIKPDKFESSKTREIIINYIQKFKPSTVTAAKIIAAIQVAEYQEIEGFNYIMFANGRTNAQVVIGEFGKDFNSNLELCLNKSEKFKDIRTDTGGTQARGGFSITV